MVTDFKEGQILGELQDLSKQISAVDVARDYFKAYCPERNCPERKDKAERLECIDKVIARMDKEYKQLEIKLKQHRQKVKESGIKF